MCASKDYGVGPGIQKWFEAFHDCGLSYTAGSLTAFNKFDKSLSYMLYDLDSFREFFPCAEIFVGFEGSGCGKDSDDSTPLLSDLNPYKLIP